MIDTGSMDDTELEIGKIDIKQQMLLLDQAKIDLLRKRQREQKRSNKSSSRDSSRSRSSIGSAQQKRAIENQLASV